MTLEHSVNRVLVCHPRNSEPLQPGPDSPATELRIVETDSPGQVLEQIKTQAPDTLVLDQALANPDLTASAIRKASVSAGLTIVVLIDDGHPGQRDEAFAWGADEVLAKPCTPAEVASTLALIDRFELRFWGVRGTLPVPGDQTLHYGGNTSCVEIRIGRDREFVFDAGTGLRKLSVHMLATQGGRFNGRIFITHPHWDHLNCLPFFAPFYIPGNRMSLMGPPQGERSFRAMLDGLMDGVYFPITPAEFRADITYGDVLEGDHHFDGVSVQCLRLNHPGYCLGYRINWRGRSVAYITDNEMGNLKPDDNYAERLIEFLSGVDLLIHDTAYFDHEYPGKINWGHSSITQVVTLARQAKVGKLLLFHHDPAHDDRELEQKLLEARKIESELGGNFECLLAREDDRWDLRTVALAGT